MPQGRKAALDQGNLQHRVRATLLVMGSLGGCMREHANFWIDGMGGRKDSEHISVS